jgi:CheY-like chemotaxis protein
VLFGPEARVRILVVDSYGWSGEALARLLQSQGYQARAAHGVADALKLCETQKFDLLIADLQLPDGSGGHLLGELARRCGAVGISMTADTGDETALESRAAGFAAHFLKPLSFELLCGTIRDVVPAEPNP